MKKQLEELRLKISREVGGTSAGRRIDKYIKDVIDSVNGTSPKAEEPEEEKEGSEAQKQELSISDLREKKKELSEEEFNALIEGDTRKSVESL